MKKYEQDSKDEEKKQQKKGNYLKKKTAMALNGYNEDKKWTENSNSKNMIKKPLVEFVEIILKIVA